MQGESDGGPGAIDMSNSAVNYGTNFQQFVSNVRADLSQYMGSTPLPIVMAVMSATNRAQVFPYITTVRQQQQTLSLSNLLTVDQVRWWGGGRWL